MRFNPLLTVFLALGLLSPLRAIGPTETDTPTATATASPTATPSASPTATGTATPTATATPGVGSWSLSIGSPLVAGSNGNKAIWSYTTDQTWSNGQLVFTFPSGISAPTTSNFYVETGHEGQINSYSPSGQKMTVDVISIPAGTSLNFYYGYLPGGFSVSTTITPLGPFYLTANFNGTSPGGVVTPNPLPVVAIGTATPTPTATPTVTVTTTYTQTPTITATYTITQTYTETPVAAAPSEGVFTYPNPFDLRVFDKVTIRFQPVPEASVQVFNLLGEPVRTMDPGDIYASKGWAIWHGEDDYNRTVVGGLYFVRVKTPNGVLIRKFTVLH